jgi:hypothetical protein
MGRGGEGGQGKRNVRKSRKERVRDGVEVGDQEGEPE